MTDQEVSLYRLKLDPQAEVFPWVELSEEGRERWRELYRKALLGPSEHEPARTVTRNYLNEIINLTFDSINKLNDTKGNEYAGDEDALANFHNRATQLDLDPMKVWGVFAGKHWDAVLSYIRRGEVLSEPIEGRINDLVLYLILLKGLIAERSSTQ